MAIDQLTGMFVHELGSLYAAEHEFLVALRHVVGQAQDPALKALLQEHIGQTEGQIRNLDEVFGHLGLPPGRVPGAAAGGLVADGQTLMREAAGDFALLDCAIASNQAKVEHLEVACYRGLVAGAELLGHAAILPLLRANLQQEEHTLEVAEQSLATLGRAVKASTAGSDAGAVLLRDLATATPAETAAGASAPDGGGAGV
jgi:ferritin-like metal-binding protein YciE